MAYRYGTAKLASRESSRLNALNNWRRENIAAAAANKNHRLVIGTAE
jgi:hypothetical protein